MGLLRRISYEISEIRKDFSEKGIERVLKCGIRDWGVLGSIC